jgi:hypothetical protein
MPGFAQGLPFCRSAYSSCEESCVSGRSNESHLSLLGSRPVEESPKYAGSQLAYVDVKATQSSCLGSLWQGGHMPILAKAGWTAVALVSHPSGTPARFRFSSHNNGRFGERVSPQSPLKKGRFRRSSARSLGYHLLFADGPFLFPSLNLPSFLRLSPVSRVALLVAVQRQSECRGATFICEATQRTHPSWALNTRGMLLSVSVLGMRSLWNSSRKLMNKPDAAISPPLQSPASRT